jgi:hypothetical protein
MSHCGSDRPTARLHHINPRSKEHEMLNVRITTLAVTLAMSGAALTAVPLASAASNPVAAATATDDHNGVQAQPGDDNGVDLQPGDDNGLRVQPGDDNGVDLQPGDDNGLHLQPGDDNGIRVQPGDDRSSDLTTSAAPRATKARTAAKEKRHTHIRRASHRVAAR